MLVHSALPIELNQGQFWALHVGHMPSVDSDGEDVGSAQSIAFTYVRAGYIWSATAENGTPTQWFGPYPTLMAAVHSATDPEVWRFIADDEDIDVSYPYPEPYMGPSPFM